MASPKLESYCCMSFNDSYINDSYGHQFDHRSINISYNSLCIMSSIMSICGACYQLTPRLPRRPPRGRSELESMLRQNVIICWLAIADLLASLGPSDLVLVNFHNIRHSYSLCLIWHMFWSDMWLGDGLSPGWCKYDSFWDQYKLLLVSKKHQWFLKSPALHMGTSSTQNSFCCTMLCYRTVSVRVSIMFIYSVKTSVNISSEFFHHRVATLFKFFCTKRHGNIPTGTP